MAEQYTAENFTASAVPGGFKTEVKDLVRDAIAVGWMMVVKSKSGIALVPPAPHDKGNHTINLSTRRNSGPIQRHRSTVLKYANPLLVPSKKTAAAHEERVHQQEGKAIQKKVYEEYEAAAQKAQASEQPQFSPTKLTVVSEGPMMSRKGTNQAYPSKIATERVYSDGSKDYICNLCDFTGTKALSMASHWKKHIHTGEAEALPDGYQRQTIQIPPVEPLYHRTGYTPRADRVAALADALAKMLKEGMDWSDPDAAARQLAERALHWQHEQSVNTTALAAEREDLTSDDVLNRIRTLLDNGLYLRQQEEIAALSRAKAEAEAKAESAAKDAQNAKDSLSAFVALAAEFNAEQEEATG